MSYHYELPWGQGKHFLNSGLSGRVLGGFAVSGISTYTSGGLLAPTTTNSLPIFNASNRPEVIGGVQQRIGPNRPGFRALNALTGDPGSVFLNMAAFAAPAPYTFGDQGAVLPNVRAFGGRNEDISITKTQYLGKESRRLELRCDLFNALNRSNLGAPIVDTTSLAFGTISSRGTPRRLQWGLRLDF